MRATVPARPRRAVRRAVAGPVVGLVVGLVAGLALTLAVPAGVAGTGAGSPAAPGDGVATPGSGAAAPAGASPARPTDRRAARRAAAPRTSPRLTVPVAKLRRAVSCPPRSRLATVRRTVLLVHGTGSSPGESFSWGFGRALRADGYGVCTVALPDHGLGDMTVAAEYVAHAARVAQRRSPAKIAVVGHSQGAALALWVTRFWPDVARRTGDVVLLAAPVNGTTVSDEYCARGRCSVIGWQSRTRSAYTAALRRGPLPAGTDYTSIASRYDQVVTPQPRASRLRGGRTIVIQDVCPASPIEHGLMLADPVSYALTLDALRHAGPASASRIPASVCLRTFIPHGDRRGSIKSVGTLGRFLASIGDPRRAIGREPRLPAYARR